MPTHTQDSAQPSLLDPVTGKLSVEISTRIHPNIHEICSVVDVHRGITMKPIQKSPQISQALKTEQEPPLNTNLLCALFCHG